jgi:hydrogenase/urease accessory protein HupE
MKKVFAIFVIFLLVGAKPIFAHRLDEYLQAATFSVDSDRIELKMRLTPGAQVFNQVLVAIGTNKDGIISGAEQQNYAERVRRDLSLNLDKQALQLYLVSVSFPKIDDMRQGLGDILLNFEADLPPGGTNRTLTLENHHLNAISVYLVNCLVPGNPEIQITSQDRNYTQSHYQLDFTLNNNPPSQLPVQAGLKTAPKLDQSGSESLFRAFFNHGIHHILTGYDHLLFISALVLAATTFWELIKVVTAFTIAHTITLTLATFNIVHLPQAVVEPLISASIVFVALQNVFWPDRSRGWTRLGAAFFFGLFHGLGFARGLIEAMQEMQTGTMLLAICAFSLGIEIGHQMIVLPLFALLKIARRTQSDEGARTKISIAIQRIGSAAISIAGMYYLCLALKGDY